MAEKLQPTGNDVMVSIHDRSQEPASLQKGWNAVLRLSFHDTDVAKPGYDLFSPEQAHQVMAFIELPDLMLEGARHPLAATRQPQLLRGRALVRGAVVGRHKLRDRHDEREGTKPIRVRHRPG